MSETVTIEFTEEQSAIISPLLLSMSEGEATIAQVYIDGFRVKVLDVETVKRVQEAIGTAKAGEGRRYAFGDIISLESENGKD